MGRVPEAGTPERREYMRTLARKGGIVTSKERRERLKFGKLVNGMLAACVPMSGQIGEILRRAGVDPKGPVTAREAIVGVFVAKAMSGDMKAARFVFDIAGLTDAAAEKRARIAYLEASAEAQRPEDPSAQTDLFDAPTPEDMRAESVRMGIYEDAEVVE